MGNMCMWMLAHIDNGSLSFYTKHNCADESLPLEIVKFYYSKYKNVINFRKIICQHLI